MDDAFAAALTAKRVARYGSSASGGSASGGGHGSGKGNFVRSGQDERLSQVMAAGRCRTLTEHPNHNAPQTTTTNTPTTNTPTTMNITTTPRLPGAAFLLGATSTGQRASRMEPFRLDSADDKPKADTAADAMSDPTADPLSRHPCPSAPLHRQLRING